MNVVFTCGGTGGHIVPAIAIANTWKEHYPDSRILFIGGTEKMERELIPEVKLTEETEKKAAARRAMTEGLHMTNPRANM